MADHYQPKALGKSEAIVTKEKKRRLDTTIENIMKVQVFLFGFLFAIIVLVSFLFIAQLIIFYVRWRAMKREKKVFVPETVVVRKEKKNNYSVTECTKSESFEKSTEFNEDLDEFDSEKDTPVFPSKEMMVNVELENIGEKAKEVIVIPPSINLSMKEPPAYDGKPKETISLTSSQASAKNTISAPLVVPVAAYTNLKVSTPSGSLTNVDEIKAAKPDTKTTSMRASSAPEQTKPVFAAIPAVVSTPPLPAKSPVTSMTSDVPVNVMVSSASQMKPPVSGPLPHGPVEPAPPQMHVKQSQIIPMAPESHVALPNVSPDPPPSASEKKEAFSAPNQDAIPQEDVPKHPNLDDLPNYRFVDSDGTAWLPIGNAFSSGKKSSNRSKKRSKTSVRNKSKKQEPLLNLGKNKSIVKSASLTFTEDKK